MKVSYKDSIEFKINALINKSKSTVFLRTDFEQLGGYRQISRALNKLLSKKKLVRIGFGIYAKAYQSEYIEYPLIEGGFQSASRDALNRLNIDWGVSRAEAAYNNGETQQIPVNNVVKLNNRCRRTIAYQNRALLFEHNVNAR